MRKNDEYRQLMMGSNMALSSVVSYHWTASITEWPQIERGINKNVL
jgi:hypothetical protein